MSTYRNQSGQFVSAIQAAEEQHAEIFYMTAREFETAHESGTWMEDYMNARDTDWTDAAMIRDDAAKLEGWYVWCCLPGCMPDSDALGPYKTEREAAIAYLD